MKLLLDLSDERVDLVDKASNEVVVNDVEVG
jgi:hypothetical protein